jgi:aminoglycoside phosphotransferase (APT) family kinase protein
MMMLNTASGDTRADLTQFSAALDQEEFRAELDRLSRTVLGWGTPQEVRTQVLRAGRLRCTFDIMVRTERGWNNVIGKVHTVERADVFQSMDAIRLAGFSPDAEFSIPQPLLYLSALHFLLVEKVSGRAATEIFLKGDPHDHRAVAERCGQWLAHFHDAAPRLGKAVDLGEALARIRRWATQIATFGDPLATKCEQLVRRLEGAAPAPSTAGYRAAHGSYMPDHVILSGRRTTAIDLDEFGVADPSRDLAWFIVSSQRLALKEHASLRSFDGAVRRFLQAYVAPAGQGAAANLPFYRAMECLHRARRDLVKRRPPVREWAELMLDEGMRVLA